MAESAIDELVMRPEKNKETIKAIARTYTESDGQADLLTIDFIRGKGEGQIFLLHGPPGTGKTLTAGNVFFNTSKSISNKEQSLWRSTQSDHCSALLQLI